MPARNLYFEISGNGIEFVAFDLRHDSPRKIDCAQLGVTQPTARKHARNLPIQQRQIEIRVVRNQDSIADEFQPCVHNVREFWRRRQQVS